MVVCYYNTTMDARTDYTQTNCSTISLLVQTGLLRLAYGLEYVNWVFPQ